MIVQQQQQLPAADEDVNPRLPILSVGPAPPLPQTPSVSSASVAPTDLTSTPDISQGHSMASDLNDSMDNDGCLYIDESYG